MTDVAAHTGLQRELEQIAAARAAVEAGTTALLVCGEAIGAGRLEARPASTRSCAALCLDRRPIRRFEDR